MADLEYYTPMEMHEEDRIIGGRLSLRQAGYLVVPAVGGYAVGVWLHGGLLMGALVALITGIPAAVLAFGRAGMFGLPGPTPSRLAEDPMAEAMALDEWLLIAWKHSRRTPVLSYAVPEENRPWG